MRYALILAIAFGVAGCETEDQTEMPQTVPPAAVSEETMPEGTGLASALSVDELPDGGAYLTDREGRALYVLEGQNDAAACTDECAQMWPPFTATPSGSAAATGSTTTGTEAATAGDQASRNAPVVGTDATGTTVMPESGTEGNDRLGAAPRDGAQAQGGQQIRPELIGTVQRPDGTTQVTYDGQPLYYYAHDSGPGEVKGQDVHDEWGEWYLVQPSGELQEGEAPEGEQQPLDS